MADNRLADPIRPRRRRRSRPPDEDLPPPLLSLPAPARRRGLLRRGWRAARYPLQIVLAPVAWGALLASLYALDPEEWDNRVYVFALLFCAVFFTLSPILYGISVRLTHSRLYREAVPFHATRQALLLAGLVVLNAVLQMLRVWSWSNFLMLLGVGALVELVALARK